MEYYNAINPKRFNNMLRLVSGNHWQAHILDQMIYRCQNSILRSDQLPCFTAPLQRLADEVGATSVKTLQNTLASLEQRALIKRVTQYTDQGKQCFIALTKTVWQSLQGPVMHGEENEEHAIYGAANDQGIHVSHSGRESPLLLHAENHYRYAAITPLLHETNGRQIFYLQMVLSYLMYRIQYQASENGVLPEKTWLPMTQDELADNLGWPLRTLQRYLHLLEQKGLIKKRKRKRNRSQVETAYCVDSIIWSASEKGNQAMRQAKQEANRNKSVKQNKSPNNEQIGRDIREKPWEEFGGFKPEDFGGHNIYINKKIYINKIHSTGKAMPDFNVARETCSEIGQSNVFLKNTTLNDKAEPDSDQLTTPLDDTGDAQPALVPAVSSGVAVQTPNANDHAEPSTRDIPDLELDTVMNPNTTLNKRQQAYLSATLHNLAVQHGCHFSDPDGLRQEFLFALKAVNHVLVGKKSFCHRLNILAKILREKRWTTPRGYEKYDAKGRAAKAKREAREAAWAAQKQTQETDQARLATVRGMGAVLAKVSPAAPVNPCTVPESVTERLTVMKQLAERAKAPDCSEAARAAIADLMREHQQIVQNEMAAQRARHVQAA